MRDAETQSKDKSTNNESQSDGSENMNFNDDVIFNNQPREGQELKLIKLDETLERSSIYGLAGHESRMMLTKTVKDLAFIVFLLVDMPLYFKEIKVFNLAEKTFQKLRKIQYISWLVQWIMTIIYQLVELKYLREYLSKNRVSVDTENVVKKKIHELKKNYYIRLYTLIHRALDIPLILHFLGIPIMSEMMSGACGVISSALCNIKFFYL